VRSLLACALLVAGVAAIYGQTAGFDFVLYDDGPYVVDNPAVRAGLGWRSLGWAFTSSHASNWHPLTWLSHMLDCSLFGIRPAGHHLINVALHAGNACLLFALLRRAAVTSWAAAVAAGLFAFHPLRVEVVAWVAERKELLGAACALLVLHAHARYAARPSFPRYALTAALFAASLMAKPTPVTLPLGLLLFDHWPLGRTDREPLRRLVLEKLPLVLLSAASAAVTLWVQRGTTSHTLALGERVANAIVSYVRYLWKTLWPHDLALLVPHPGLPGGEPWTAAEIAGALLLLAALSAAVWHWRERRFLVVGWLWFLVTLVPMIGLVQVGVQAMADRYTYLPAIGLSLAVAGGLDARRGGRLAAPARPAAGPALAAVAVLAALALGAWLQARHWRDSFALFERATVIHPTSADAQTNLGAAYESEGVVHEAAERYRLALAIDPNHAGAHLRLANCLVVLGETALAEEHFGRAVALDPARPETHFNIGLLLASRGRGDEAIASYRRAVELRPTYFAALLNLGSALIARGEAVEAEAPLRRALQVRPADPRAHNTLAVALMRSGRPAEALERFARASAIAPDWPQPLVARAWILATSPDARGSAEAVRLAERAAELSARRNPVVLDTLAVAYAADGQFERATATAEIARGLAEQAGKTALVAFLEARLAMLRNGPPLPLAIAPIE